MGFRVDLSQETANTIEAGSTCPAGFHRAVVDDTFMEDSSGDQIFEFHVVSGSGRGSVVRERLFNPDNSGDEKQQKRSLTRVKLFANRLGLVKSEDFGKPDVELDFLQAIGKEVVIEAIHKPGDKGVFVNTQWDGIYPLDSEKIPAAVRAALGLPTLPAHASAAAANAEANGSAGKGKGGGRGKGKAQEPVGAGAGAGATDGIPNDL